MQQCDQNVRICLLHLPYWRYSTFISLDVSISIADSSWVTLYCIYFIYMYIRHFVFFSPSRKAYLLLLVLFSGTYNLTWFCIFVAFKLTYRIMFGYNTLLVIVMFCTPVFAWDIYYVSFLSSIEQYLQKLM